MSGLAEALIVLFCFGAVYLVFGFAVWAFIFTHGGFLNPDGRTPAPFWRCLLRTTLMWPAALKALEVL